MKARAAMEKLTKKHDHNALIKAASLFSSFGDSTWALQVVTSVLEESKISDGDKRLATIAQLKYANIVKGTAARPAPSALLTQGRSITTPQSQQKRHSREAARTLPHPAAATVMAVPMPPPWPQLQMAPATEPKRRRPPQDELFSGPTHRASLTHQSPFHEIYRDIVDPTATANTVDDYHVQEYEAGSSESYSAADTRAENTAAPLDASSPLHRSQTTALSAHAVGVPGATAEIVIAPIVNVPIANATVLHTTTLPPRFQAPAPVAPSAAMDDDDDDDAVIAANVDGGQTRGAKDVGVSTDMPDDGSDEDVTTPDASAPTAHANVLPATTPMPISQAPDNYAAAMAHVGEAEDVISPATVAPHARLTPLPADWSSKSKRAKKYWMQTHH